MTEWKTIDSCPRDGTVVAVYLPWVRQVRTGHYSKGHSRWMVHWSPSQKAFLYREPSHWTPLPAPPSIENDRATDAERAFHADGASQ